MEPNCVILHLIILPTIQVDIISNLPGVRPQIRLASTPVSWLKSNRSDQWYFCQAAVKHCPAVHQNHGDVMTTMA